METKTLKTDDGVNYLDLDGDSPNKSRFIRVKSVNTPLIDYLDVNGNVTTPANSSSLPQLGSGSSHGGFTGGSDGIWI